MKNDARDRCDLEYRWCTRCYWGKTNYHADGDPPSIKRVLRELLAVQLWSWAITLKCWAWEVDPQTVAGLDSRLAKDES